MGGYELYQKKHPHIIKPELHTKNIGIPKNFNSCLNRISGKYTCFVSGDDLFKGESILNSVKFLEKNNSFIGTYAKHEAFESDTKKILWEYNPKRRRIESVNDILKFGHSYHIPLFTLFLRSSELEPLETKLKYSNDALFSAQMEFKGKLHFFNESFYLYRKHKTSITRELKNDIVTSFKEKTLFYNILHKRIKASSLDLNLAYAREHIFLAFQQLTLGINKKEAIKNINKSIEYYETPLKESVTYLIKAKAIWFLLQWIMKYLAKINALFLIRFSYNIYRKMNLNPRLTY